MQWDSLDWTRRVHESMLHVVGQAQYVGCGVSRSVGQVPIVGTVVHT